MLVDPEAATELLHPVLEGVKLHFVVHSVTYAKINISATLDSVELQTRVARVVRALWGYLCLCTFQYSMSDIFSLTFWSIGAALLPLSLTTFCLLPRL